ncbi:hypothetical protein ACQEVZ_02665 [Dactylosporangium sp. CA-152071]|uniref:hypothetical protein n=1 Tax=Dactylosporangium sp. CA-152071 TaxID=3239933 RepID=UPI003D93C2B2
MIFAAPVDVADLSDEDGGQDRAKAGDRLDRVEPGGARPAASAPPLVRASIFAVDGVDEPASGFAATLTKEQGHSLGRVD